MAFHYLATIFREMVILGKTFVTGYWFRPVEELFEVIVLLWLEDCCIFILIFHIHNCIVVLHLLISALYVDVV